MTDIKMIYILKIYKHKFGKNKWNGKISLKNSNQTYPIKSR